MAGNSFGHIFKLTSYGESHGPAVGGIIEGCPAGLEIDAAFVQAELNKRKPGQSSLTTTRSEDDIVTFLSGIYNNQATGAPIAFEIINTNQNSADYGNVEKTYRPSHADFTYDQKYGFRDHRGGGRSSARETIARVVAGAIAKLFLQRSGISIHAFVQSVGAIRTNVDINTFDPLLIEKTSVRCPDLATAQQMIQAIENAKQKGDSLGGTITCVIQGLPAGLGEPVFDKFHAVLGHAMLSINAVKGFEYGSGFKGSQLYGSQHNDAFVNDGSGIKTSTNHSGGVQGGITNGMPVYCTVAFKPTATILQTQKTVNQAGENTVLEMHGRHDPCVLPRAVPIVEAMAAMVCTDFLLQNKTTKL